jgi:hypothetical protein
MSMMDMMGLGGGGDPMAGGPPMGDPMAGGPPPGPPAGGGEDSVAEIQEALNALQDILRETMDPEVQAAVSTAESALSKLVLALQKQKDAAMGTTPAHKYVERASAGAPPAGGGY